MFTLNTKQFEDFDLNIAEQFVEYWSKHYSDGNIKVFKSDETIDYILGEAKQVRGSMSDWHKLLVEITGVNPVPEGQSPFLNIHQVSFGYPFAGFFDNRFQDLPMFC